MTLGSGLSFGKIRLRDGENRLKARGGHGLGHFITAFEILPAAAAILHNQKKSCTID